MTRSGSLCGMGLALLLSARALAGGPLDGLRACGGPHARVVRVEDGKQLTAALAEARPGDLIQLAAGVYAGKFVAAASGTAAAPILLCGPRGAVLDAGSVRSGYGLHVTGSHWVFAGFTVAHAKKGIMLDGASGNLLVGLEVREIGNEGVHFRAFSSDNVLRDSYIHDTGKDGPPRFGEGVYIGSAHQHWCDYSGCEPDRSDRNQILDNTIGPNTTAECIDVKEGTAGGVLRGNTFSGAGMVAPGGADSWVDVKGNGYRVEHNRGVVSPGDGFQVYEKVAGWGRDNIFIANVADVRGPGFGFKIAGGTGNVVAADNVVQAARRGVANVPVRRSGGRRR